MLFFLFLIYFYENKTDKEKYGIMYKLLCKIINTGANNIMTSTDPELIDELTELLLEGAKRGITYAHITEKGMVWSHKDHGGMEDAIPYKLLLVATCVDKYIEETGNAKWENRDGIDGILWLENAAILKDNEWMPLDNIGLNRTIGFYSISLFPYAENHAELEEE